MKYEIKNRFSGDIIFSIEAESLKLAVEAAIKSRAYLSGAYLSDAYLSDADLSGADLSDADLSGAYLSDADLSRANLSGAYLSGAYLSDADLSGANLSGAYLSGAYLSDAYLSDADLSGAYLSDADLSRANLSGAYLSGAYLSDADLSGANLSGAKNIPTGIELKDPPEPYVRKKYDYAARAEHYRSLHPEVPVIPDLDKKILEVITNGGGKLDMSAWHTCETTHCRAGWAITLAGEAGRELEKKVDSRWAATMIYRASTGRVPHFYATNEQAMEDIKACAEGTAK